MDAMQLQLENAVGPQERIRIAAAGVSIDGFRLNGTVRPADLHACWHDAVAIAEDRILISLGDIVGSGHDGGSLLRELREMLAGADADMQPVALLREADALLCSRTPAAYATAIVGIVDLRAQTFTYVAAGHPPPYVRYADGRVVALPADGLPIGLAQRDHPTAQVVVDLRGATLLAVHTSGLVQTTRNLEADLERLPRVVADDRLLYGDGPANWLARSMLGDRLHDDVAVVTLAFAKCVAAPAGDLPGWKICWSFEATAAASNSVRCALLSCLASKHRRAAALDLYAAELIFGELMSNVVRHAPGPVDVVLDWNDELPVLHVIDNGPGYHSRGERARLPFDDWSESGRGLFIINACAAKLRVRNRPGHGTHVAATLPLS